ncbi:hypothetical protein D9M71_777640 [compost metagenome]
MEAGPGAIPAGHGKQQGTDPDDPGQHQHKGSKTVDHQHDAKRRRPVAGQVDTDGAGLALALYPQQQGDGDRQSQQAGEQVEAGLEGAALFA